MSHQQVSSLFPSLRCGDRQAGCQQCLHARQCRRRKAGTHQHQQLPTNLLQTKWINNERESREQTYISIINDAALLFEARTCDIYRESGSSVN